MQIVFADELDATRLKSLDTRGHLLVVVLQLLDKIDQLLIGARGSDFFDLLVKLFVLLNELVSFSAAKIQLVIKSI